MRQFNMLWMKSHFAVIRDGARHYPKDTTVKNSCHFERREKSAFSLNNGKADFSPDEAGFEMTVFFTVVLLRSTHR